jgi:hypothetical protein
MLIPLKASPIDTAWFPAARLCSSPTPRFTQLPALLLLATTLNKHLGIFQVGKETLLCNVLQLCECVRHLEASLVCTEQPQSASCRLDSSGRLRLQLPGRHGTAIQPHTKPRVHCAGAVRRSTVPLATRGVYRCVSAGQVEGQWRGTHVGSG